MECVLRKTKPNYLSEKLNNNYKMKKRMKNKECRLREKSRVLFD